MKMKMKMKMNFNIIAKNNCINFYFVKFYSATQK